MSQFAQQRANRVVENALSELGELIDQDEINNLREFFVCDEFAQICQNIFENVDADNSGSIDQDELYQAFQNVLRELPGVEQALINMGNNVDQVNHALSVELINATFTALDFDNSGSLEWDEFPNAIRLIWTRSLMIVHSKPPSDFLVETALENLVNQAGQGIGAYLYDYFNKFEFKDLCDRVFEGADADKSENIDKKELKAAFTYIVEKQVGEINAGFGQVGLDAVELDAVIDDQTIQDIYQELDSNESGALEKFEFGNAIKLIWIKAAIVSHTRKFGQTKNLVENALQEAVSQLGLIRVNFLREMFSNIEFENACTRAFHAIDVDNGGSIDRKEIFKGFEAVWRSIPGLREEMATEQGMNITNLFDQEEDIKNMLQETFEVFDVDSNGTLDLNEFPHVVKLVLIKCLRGANKNKLFADDEKPVFDDDDDDNDTKQDDDNDNDDTNDDASDEKSSKRVKLDRIEIELIQLSSEGEAADEKASYLREIFDNDEFNEACQTVWTQVDQDQSESVDKDELGDAFHIVIEHVPGMKDKLAALNFNMSNKAQMRVLMKQVIRAIYEYPELEGKDELDPYHFVMAIKLMWIKLMSM